MMKLFSTTLLIFVACQARAGSTPLLELRDASRAMKSDALLVVEDGRTLIEEYTGGTPAIETGQSITKSMLSLAAGLLIEDGKLASLDVPVATWFPEWAPGRGEIAKAAVTLRQLLRHDSGLSDSDDYFKQPDYVQAALALPLQWGVGAGFHYSNAGAQILAAALGRIAGTPVDLYLRDRLFAPLGVTQWRWNHDSAGNPSGGGGLSISAPDLLRVGQMMLDGGKFAGQQVVPADWVRESTSPDAGFESCYGLMWWVVRGPFPAPVASADGPVASCPQGGVPVSQLSPQEGFEAIGYGGQYLVVLPAKRLIGIRMRILRDSESDDDTQRLNFRRFPELLRAL